MAQRDPGGTAGKRARSRYDEGGEEVAQPVVIVDYIGEASGGTAWHSTLPFRTPADSSPNNGVRTHRLARMGRRGVAHYANSEGIGPIQVFPDTRGAASMLGARRNVADGVSPYRAR